MLLFNAKWNDHCKILKKRAKYPNEVSDGFIHYFVKKNVTIISVTVLQTIQRHEVYMYIAACTINKRYSSSVRERHDPNFHYITILP